MKPQEQIQPEAHADLIINRKILRCAWQETKLNQFHKGDTKQK